MSETAMGRTVYRSLSYDPWFNLALEEYLLDRVRPGKIILYIWQNGNTVVIGRNQNAWKECRTDLLNNEGGKLARRLSGGGAVYHDLGNLNFTFIMDRSLYDLERQLRVILGAVRSFGIPAEFSGRNDLLAGGKKFSGNAFCFRGSSAYHHGTLLLNVDFSRLARYLQVSPEKINSKGIDSVRSRVVNLTELNPALDLTAMIQGMEESFAAAYGKTGERITVDPAVMGLDTLYDKYASWEWIFGRTPCFDITLAGRFDWGEVEIGFRLRNGMVAEAAAFSDAMDEELIRKIGGTLKDSLFQKEALICRLTKLSEGDDLRRTMIRDLSGWLSAKEI